MAENAAESRDLARTDDPATGISRTRLRRASSARCQIAIGAFERRVTMPVYFIGIEHGDTAVETTRQTRAFSSGRRYRRIRLEARLTGKLDASLRFPERGRGQGCRAVPRRGHSGAPLPRRARLPARLLSRGCRRSGCPRWDEGRGAAGQRRHLWVEIKNCPPLAGHEFKSSRHRGVSADCQLPRNFSALAIAGP